MQNIKTIKYSLGLEFGWGNERGEGSYRFSQIDSYGSANITGGTLALSGARHSLDFCLAGRLAIYGGYRLG